MAAGAGCGPGKRDPIPELRGTPSQMYTATKNNKRLKSLYQKALQIKSAIPHPKIMGVIRECGGKMHMAQREWELARNDFFEAFKNYDEAGVQRRVQCLKYLVLANMLMNSDINPFDSQEAKPYKNDPEILAMTNLVSACAPPPHILRARPRSPLAPCAPRPDWCRGALRGVVVVCTSCPVH